MARDVKSKLKPAIILLIFLILLVAGFFIVRSILNSKNIDILNFGNNTESYNSNDFNTNISGSSLDDIFGDSLTDADKDFLTTNNNILSSNNNNLESNNSIKLDDNGLYEVYENNIPDSSNNNVSSQNDKVSNVDVKTFDSTKIKESAVKVSNNKVTINSFIINYNDRFVATRDNPLLITLGVKTPPKGRFAKIRVYARRVDDNYKILSRDLVFYLPKIYVIDGNIQTQFYFSGRISSSANYLPKGRYLLYAEVEVVDSKGKSVGKAGRYPLPKWNHVITLR